MGASEKVREDFGNVVEVGGVLFVLVVVGSFHGGSG